MMINTRLKPALTAIPLQRGRVKRTLAVDRVQQNVGIYEHYEPSAIYI